MKAGLTLPLLIVGAASFSPAAAQTFNAFEASAPPGATSGVIKTKIAGGTFSTSSGALRVVAINVLGTLDILFTGTVQVALIDSGEACNTKRTIQSLGDVLLVGGVGTLNPTVADAYRDVRIQVAWKVGKVTVYGCSTDRFAIRPAALVAGASDKDWQTAGTARILDNAAASGGLVHGAGQPFRLTATATNLANITTESYAGTPTLASISLVQPAPGLCPACALGTLALGAWSAKKGILTSTTATYTEAGSITVALEDRTFADIDLADSTAAERTIASSPVTVGRFVPSTFALQLNAPQLQAFGSGCVGRSFTYLGQPFGYAIAPVAAVTARNAAGGTTANFRSSGGLWSLKSPLTTAGNACSTTVCTLRRSDATAKTHLTTTYSCTSTGDQPRWDGTKAVIGDATLASGDNGTGALTLPSSDRIALLRPGDPAAPANVTVAMTLRLEDRSESGPAGNPAAIEGSLTTELPFDFGGGEFRYGRIRLVNAYGSQQLDLMMPMQVEYWQSAAAGWRLATADNCTGGDPASAVGVLLTPPPGWPGGAACVRDVGNPGLSGAGCADLAVPARRFMDPPVAGNFNLWLAAPMSSGKLLVAGQVPSWLTWNWTGTVGNPVGTATFGIDRQRPLIFQRELY